MNGTREKVVVAMSGGVDSSVAACLLVEQGYDVIGLFMRVGVEEVSSEDSGTPSLSAPAVDVGPSPARPESIPADGTPIPPGRVPPVGQEAQADKGSATRVHQGCCSAADAADARFVAGMLEVPFYALNFKEDFERIIDYFVDEYVSGRTPNPCVVCNDRLKFGKLVDYADAVGAKYIATGHYARIGERDGKKALLRGCDRTKDQSYVLFGLDRAILDRVLFPVGELAKSEVREIAARFNLPNRDKPDSVDICFVPDRDYARVVRERRPEAFVEGNVVDHSGGTIGTHKGIGNYTIGQRRGLGIAAGKPIYVTRLDVETNTVTMGEDEALLASSLSADRVNLLADPPPRFTATVKIRYLHEASPATVELLDDHRMTIRFDEPQRAITPGQAVVFYDGDTVLGGGWIERSRIDGVYAGANMPAHV